MAGTAPANALAGLTGGFGAFTAHLRQVVRQAVVLNWVTMSRAGEHLPNVSMATLASPRPTRSPCTKSPSTPPTMSPLPSGGPGVPWSKPSALPCR